MAETGRPTIEAGSAEIVPEEAVAGIVRVTRLWLPATNEPLLPRSTVEVSVLSSRLSFDSLNPSDHPKTSVNPQRFVMS